MFTDFKVETKNSVVIWIKCCSVEPKENVENRSHFETIGTLTEIKSLKESSGIALTRELICA